MTLTREQVEQHASDMAPDGLSRAQLAHLKVLLEVDAALRQDLDAMAMLTWTTTTPTQPGWYWYRRDKHARPEVKDLANLKAFEVQFYLTNHDGEWSSEALEPPKEE